VNVHRTTLRYPEQVATPHNAETDRTEVLLSHLDELPTLPAVAIRLIQVSANPDVSIDEICDTLRGDPALVARVLTAANCAAGGAVSPIETLESAVVRLGMRQVRGIALAAQIFECFERATPDSLTPPDFDPIGFWEHSLAVATGSQMIAESIGEDDLQTGLVFIAGLLHDMGKIALATIYPKAYARVASRARGTHGDIADSEREILGVDHTVAGRRLAQRWKLPPDLVDVIWLHHLAIDALPRERRATRLLSIVQVADAMAREQHIGFSGNFPLLERSEKLGELIGLDGEMHQYIMARLPDAVHEWTRQLNLRGDTTPEVFQAALRQANLELGSMHARALDSARQSASVVRYFNALTAIDAELGSSADVPALLRALSVVMPQALTCSVVAAFIVRPRERLLEASVYAQGRTFTRSVALNDAVSIARWWSDPGESMTGLVTDAPPALREHLSEIFMPLGTGRTWMIPLVREGKVLGGLLYARDRDERAELVESGGSMRPLLASLSSLVHRSLVYADAQRLSDELAESNRRLQQIQNEMLRTRTLSTIAEIAAGAGHEMNNPLSVISGRAQMLRSQLGEEAQRDLSLIIDKSHECSQVVKELMDFARPKPLSFEPAELSEIVIQTCEKWQAEHEFAPEQLRVEVMDGLPLVLADREQFAVVIVELLNNARAATESTGAMIDVIVAAREQGWVGVEIRDQGPGMNSQVLERAFDPFFSHLSAGRRRGLGLARAQRIVHGHCGRIWIDSRVGAGTCVFILLHEHHPAK
jgi:putative nucleotidyltransferase with HDIG domain